MQRITSQKVALVTAAGRRIGAATARVLHNAGMNVTLHYHRSKDEAEKLASELNSKRENSAITICSNLETDAKDFNKKLIDPIIHQWGRLDVLVNNASQFFETPVGETPIEQFDKIMNTNVRAPFFLIQAAAPYLRVHGGCVVNLTDIVGKRSYLNYSVYSASKAALSAFTSSLAGEYAPVRVNAVAPGVIDWTEGVNELTPEQKETLLSETPLKSIGTFEDIANTVLFLTTATHIDGQTIKVDGGKSHTPWQIGKAKPWAERTPLPSITGNTNGFHHHPTQPTTRDLSPEPPKLD